MKDYYEILEVSPRASKELIENSYNILKEKYNPDSISNLEQKEIFTQKTIQITEAYKILSDDFLREQYDTERNKEVENISYNVNRNVNSKLKDTQVEYIKPKVKKEKAQYQVGSFKSIANLTSQLFRDIPKDKLKKGLDKKGVMSLLGAIGIVILIGVILWFIPFTNGFMRSFLLMS